MRKTPLEKEWQGLLKKEQSILKKKQNNSVSIYKGIEKFVPELMQKNLNLAFCKGFETVFQKGDGLINKTLSPQKHIDQYKINEFTANIKPSKRNIKAVSKSARLTNSKNAVIAGVEGAGLGLLGVGLPDIPIFIGTILKSVYEVAMDYGFSYDSQQEKIFVLKLISASLSQGAEFIAKEQEINEVIVCGLDMLDERNFQSAVKVAAESLSTELLYAKFVQGLPIIGVVGGVSNIGCISKITQYASLKYYKRFLTAKMDI